MDSDVHYIVTTSRLFLSERPVVNGQNVDSTGTVSDSVGSDTLERCL